MKNLFFLVMLLCMAHTTYTQCPDNATEDARVVYLDFQFGGNLNGLVKLCKQHCLYNEVHFIPVFSPEYDESFWEDKTFWCHIEGSHDFQLFRDQVAVYTFPANNTGSIQTYDIWFKVLNSNGSVYVQDLVPQEFTIKPNTSVNGAGYTQPDEIWEISSSATYAPPIQGAFPSGSQYNGNALGGAHAYIKYAPAHNGKLLKPLIFVDGVDFNSKTYTHSGEVIRHGSTGWDVLVMGNDASAPNPYDVDANGVPVPSEFSYYPTAFNTFLSEPNNYDIIFLDFGEGADWIQKNGLLLVELIERVNERKATHAINGESVCDNAVIGASMGGQVAKWALSYMEESNLNHQCHTYVSFDSPHKGAHIPIGLQSLVYLNNRIGNDPGNNWTDLNAPAARQMVIETLEGGIVAGRLTPTLYEREFCASASVTPLPLNLDFNSSNEIRSSFTGEMGGLGYPQTTRNVAISCGSSNGTKVAGNAYFKTHWHENPPNIACSVQGDIISLESIGFDGGSLSIPHILSFSGGAGGEWGCCTRSISPVSNSVFLGMIPTGFEPWVFGGEDPPKIYTVFRVVATYDYPSLDNAPGCKRGDLVTIEKEIREGSDNFVIDANDKYSSFMPTLSLLDIQWPMDDEHLIMPFEEDELVSQGLTPFDAVFAPTVNLRHVELTSAMASWVLQQLALGLAEAQGAALILASGQTFNYGKRKNRVPDVTIHNGARLAVNITGNINYMTTQDPVADNLHFEVYTGGGCNQGKTITVKNGGILQIGDPGSTKTGYFHALAQSVIKVESGGILRISNASTLRIYHGAQLILDPGAIVQLESAGANIRIEGDLIVNGNINFAGLGFFDFGPDNRLVFGPGYNTFNLVGAGKSQRFVRLSADLLVDDNHRLNWSQGLLEVNGGTLRFVDGAGLDFTDMTLTSGDNIGYSAIAAVGSGAIRLQGCTVERLSVPIEGVGGQGCSITSSAFSQYAIGMHWNTAAAVSASFSSFNGAGSVGPSAMLMEDVALLFLTGNQFFGHSDPIQGAIDDASLSQAAPALSLDNMVACLVKDCHFVGNTVGIKSDNPGSGGTANVFAFGGSSFVQNDAAIFVVGDATRGTVLADCVLFDQNLNGIRGRDIALMIDSWNSKTFSFDTDSPNTFVRDNAPQGGVTESHVRICYEQKGVGGSNLMRNNFWGIATGGIPVNDPLPQSSVFLQNAACTANIAAPVFAPFGSKNPVCAPEERPSSFANPFPGSECMVVVGIGGPSNSPVRVHEQFHLGTYLMRADSVAEGIEAMRPVAALWQADLNGFSDNCQQYIRVAKAFVDASDSSGPGLPRPGGERAPSPEWGNLLIAPNPASQLALLHLPEIDQQVRVWDARGNLCHQAAAFGTYRLDVAAWQPGIYFVEALTDDGSRKNAKLVVQR